MPKNILATAAALVMGVGILGAPAAYAASGHTAMHHAARHHHTCKSGAAAHHVKVHGKWIWSCRSSHHHHHHHASH